MPKKTIKTPEAAMQSRRHLTLNERENLQKLRVEGKSQRAIAEMMNRSQSTISRELSRNKTPTGRYEYHYADATAKHRRKNSVKLFVIVKNPEVAAYVKAKLQEIWSPEQIANRMGKALEGLRVCQRTIYRAIDRGLLPEITAKKDLLFHGKKRCCDHKKYITIKPDHKISERPLDANNREVPGHFEGDTVFGARGCAVTLVDRRTRELIAAPCKTHSSDEIAEAIAKLLSGRKVLSITFDNGSEFAKHRQLATRLNTTVYFADLKSPWQRGTNEHTNRYLRFQYPRGTDFTKVTREQFARSVELINNRPRKAFGWLSATEFSRLYPIPSLSAS